MSRERPDGRRILPPFVVRVGFQKDLDVSGGEFLSAQLFCNDAHVAGQRLQQFIECGEWHAKALHAADRFISRGKFL